MANYGIGLFAAAESFLTDLSAEDEALIAGGGGKWGSKSRSKKSRKSKSKSKSKHRGCFCY